MSEAIDVGSDEDFIIDDEFKKDRRQTQVLINTANIVDQADQNMLPVLYSDIQLTTGLSIQQLGNITLARALLQSISSPIWGWLSDRYSRKTILGIGCIIWGVFTSLLGAIFSGNLSINSNYAGMIIVRAFIGLGLAVIFPTAQSLVADFFPKSKRGQAFGILGLTGIVGAIVGMLMAGFMSGVMIGSLEGWRFSFIIIGGLSVILGILVMSFGKDPTRGGLERGLKVEKKEKYKITWKDYKTILSNKTFIFLILQGCAGSIPWNSILWMPYWLEHLGFDASLTAIAFAVVAIGAAGGHLFGGYIGDKAEKWKPDKGRLIVAQISVLSGIPMMFILFLAMPRASTTGALIGFIILGIITGFLISWCAPSTNNPIFSELFIPEIRGTAFSVDRLFEGSVAASGTAIVAAIAGGFGFTDPGPGNPISSLSALEISTNIDAMAWALIIATVIPWTICFIFYTFIYFTYPKDRDSTRKAIFESRMQEEKTNVSEKKSTDETEAINESDNGG
ncbi:MAG: MFS transporter [Asgard group archaeon]|nr:MFS transporter [Asgard group archaeon]